MPESPGVEDLGFRYRVRKNGEVEIFHRGRLASTLRGQDAVAFTQSNPDERSVQAQQRMARITGNYKHGGERVARVHPRNMK